MKFKSKTRLKQHLAEMVKSGYLIPEWKVEFVGKNKDPISNPTRIYIANFEKFKGEEK